MTTQTAHFISSSQPNQRLLQLISPSVTALGYEIIFLELQRNVLRVYIDHLNPEAGKIGIEDCVKVSRVLDEFLDQSAEIANLLPSTYELEVSSPGVDRPLRTSKDFERFVGRLIKIHVFRPLTAEELNNAKYQEKNPKQKNFVGKLVGYQDERVVLSIPLGPQKGTSQGSKKKSKFGSGIKNKNFTPEQGDAVMGEKDISDTASTTNSVEENRVTIPLPLISKANLEPEFDFEGSNERE